MTTTMPQPAAAVPSRLHGKQGNEDFCMKQLNIINLKQYNVIN